MKSTKIQITKVPLMDSPPDQLEVRNGKLVCLDGTKPDFSAIPDGKYNLVPRESYIEIKTLAACAGIG